MMFATYYYSIFLLLLSLFSLKEYERLHTLVEIAYPLVLIYSILTIFYYQNKQNKNKNPVSNKKYKNDNQVN